MIVSAPAADAYLARGPRKPTKTTRCHASHMSAVHSRGHMSRGSVHGAVGRGRGFASKKMVRVGDTLYAKTGSALVKQMHPSSAATAHGSAASCGEGGAHSGGRGCAGVRGMTRRAGVRARGQPGSTWSWTGRGRGLSVRSRGVSKHSIRGGRGALRWGPASRWRSMRGGGASLSRALSRDRGATRGRRALYKSKTLHRGASTAGAVGGKEGARSIAPNSFEISIGGCRYRRDAGSKHLVRIGAAAGAACEPD
jgi:hypothetical protein